MIIREYEYDEKRPWNCQERFLDFRGYDDPWQEYKNKLLGTLPSDISMRDRIIKDTMREDRNALSFEFEINGGRFVHVSQDWKQYLGDLIVKEYEMNRRPVMNLYKRQIKPVKHNAYCTTNTPLEDAWYDESEEDTLRNKYENNFEDCFDSLVFAERYIKIENGQNNRLELLEDK